MTKKETLENYRKMWGWIAMETLREKKKINKIDYFERLGITDIPIRFCYLCEYVNQLHRIISNCRNCPIQWGKQKTCCADDSLYYKWCKTYDYELCAKYAKEISELEERKTKKFDIAEVDK